jgi:hypothetical protein
MSSSQSLTTTEMLGFRTLIAVFLRIVALLRSFRSRMRNLRRGDVLRAVGRGGCPAIWVFAQYYGWLRTLLVPVPWHDTSGGRDGPSACRRITSFKLATAARAALQPRVRAARVRN